MYECQRPCRKKMTYSFLFREKSSAWTLPSLIYTDVYSRYCDDSSSWCLLCLDSQWECNKVIQYPFPSSKKPRTFISRKSSRYPYRRRSSYRISDEFFDYFFHANGRSSWVSCDEMTATPRKRITNNEYLIIRE